MKTITQFIRTTILGGLLFLVPIVVLIVIIAKAFQFAKRVSGLTCSHSCGLGHRRGRGDVAIGFARRNRLLCCWSRRPHHTCPTRGRRIGAVSTLEDSRLRVSEAGECEHAGRRRDQENSPWCSYAMEGGWQFGVQTEALGNDLISVFVPGAPNPHSGSVFFFPADIVRPADVRMAAALNCLRRCGAGASTLGANWPMKAL